jgi:ElaB/YqjD/DUF883 family membrane-anchored ribosome-binding protein
MGKGASHVSESGDRAFDRDTAERLGDIEQTRSALHETVEEIAERLTPSAIVENAKETVRDATVGKVEDMADTAGIAAQQTSQGIVETIRRNPIPAAMAGIGLAWLMTHRSSAAPANWTDRRPTTWAGSDDWGKGRGSPGMAERIGNASTEFGERVGEAGDKVGDRVDDLSRTVSDRVDRVGDSISDWPEEASYRARDLGDQARTLIQDSPLAVGAAAIAVGTALGAALPSTGPERRVLGPAVDKAVRAGEQTASAALADAEHELRDVEQDTLQAASSTGAGSRKADNDRNRSSKTGP